VPAPSPSPSLLALDFDGVLCDGMSEYFGSAWHACRHLRPSLAPDPPRGLAEGFARVRPVIEHGWEMPLLIMALLSGASEADILERWRPEARLAESALGRGEIAAALDGARDEWIARSEADWLDQHRFYPGVIERLRRLREGPTRLVVVTTKEGRFARKLLARQGLDLGVDDVYGKEAARPKSTILSELAEPRSPARRLWFVEDRLQTLDAVKRTRGLEDVGLFLADWGYNTARDRETAREDDRIVLLSLGQFAGDFADWVRASPSRHT
jgi:phosphoglycolate phosphatase-like HAD superfamily hydrolase